MKDRIATNVVKNLSALGLFIVLLMWCEANSKRLDRLEKLVEAHSFAIPRHFHDSAELIGTNMDVVRIRRTGNQITLTNWESLPTEGLKP